MTAPSKFTIFALTYGDHTDLFYRCMTSILQTCREAVPANIVVGLNEVSRRTHRYVDSLIEKKWILLENVHTSVNNIHKYPMMRRMFYGARAHTRPAPYFMWFDDDSFVKPEMKGAAPSFLTRVESAFASGPPDAHVAMVGAIYTQKLAGRQADWIRDQPWHKGQPVRDPARFATGGWWAARSEDLFALNYPWPALDHRGGDVMLGQCLDQQGWHVVNFRDGVAINADKDGRESKAPRRGYDSAPIGQFYDPITKTERTVPQCSQITGHSGPARRSVIELDL